MNIRVEVWLSADLEQALIFLERLGFTNAEQEWRGRDARCRPSLLDWLTNLRFAGSVDFMDYLNFVIVLHEKLGIDSPEVDFPALTTLDGRVAYLRRRLAEHGA